MSHQNKVAIVTGANAGLGFEVTRQLGQAGFTVVMACRSLQRAETARAKLTNEASPLTSGSYVPMLLDVSEYHSVRDFVQQFLTKYDRLDVLVNNAGVSLKKRTLNSLGHELTLATNHLGHFLLTNLLLNILKQTAAKQQQARILIVASLLHDIGQKFARLKATDWDDLMLEKEGAYSSMQAYKNSKLMNVMHTIQLAQKLEGSGVFVNTMCPGFVPTTEMAGKSAGSCVRCFLICCFSGVLCCCNITRSLPEAGGHMFRIAVGDSPYQTSNGIFFSDGLEKTPAAEALDCEKQERMWSWSEQMLSVTADNHALRDKK